MSTTPALTEMLRGLAPDMRASSTFVTGAVEMSWGDLAERVARTRGLLARLGVGSGDRIALVSNDDLAVCGLYGACLLSGVVAVVVDPDASASEVNVLLAKAKVSAVFADQPVIDRAGTLQNDDAVPIIAIAAGPAKTGFGLLVRRKNKGSAASDTYPAMLDAESLVEDRPELPNEAPALILFTSGTTSQPKGVVMTRGNLAAQLVTFAHHYGYAPASRIGNHLPLHHSDGLNQGALLAMSLGSTWIRPAAADMQSLGDMLDLLQRNRATHLITVPTVIAMMTRLPEAWNDAFSGDDFEFISSTAGHLDETIWATVEERFGTQIVNSYGLTETVMEALYCGPSETTRRVGTIGKPVDCETRLVDDEGNDVAPGEIGELWLRGENIMAGYFEHPEATSAVLTDDGWLRTGDLARSDDGFFSIAGRKKSVIIRGGINVYPEDVNTVLVTAPGVLAASTVGVPDPFVGELVVACVTADAGSDPDTVSATLMAQCRAELAEEKVPNRIFVVDELPYGPSGKVELAKVVQMSLDLMGGTIEGGSTRDQVLHVAARVFGQPVEELSEASNPDMTPGWDSLTFLELIMELERQFDMSIAPRDVMTMASLDDAISLVEHR